LFTNARWSGDALGLALADLIVARLLPTDAALTVAVDDTLFKRSGKKVFGAAWHHDGAAKGPKPIGFGNCWVVAGIVVQLSFLSRPVCLPVLARLWRPRHTGKIAYARELAELIAARYRRSSPPTGSPRPASCIPWPARSSSGTRCSVATAHPVRSVRRSGSQSYQVATARWAFSSLMARSTTLRCAA
jgi:hypothetical protein